METSMKENVEKIVRELIVHIDEQPEREGLTETPARYAKFLQEFLQPAPFKATAFEGDGYDEMVLQTNIPFYSICEHHLVPFFGHGTIAYIPDKKIIGLSKLARILDACSR